MDEDNKMKRALDTVDTLARSMREGSKTISDQQRHQDSMVMWIVGLASAAVVSLPPTYNHLMDQKGASPWALGIPITFFVLAVLSGVAVRLLLLKLIQEDWLLATRKIWGWEALKVDHSEGEDGRKKLLQEALEIMNDGKAVILAQKTKVDKIVRWLKMIEWLPFVLFALGVLSAARFVVFAPPTGSKAMTMASWLLQIMGLFTSACGAVLIVSAQWDSGEAKGIVRQEGNAYRRSPFVTLEHPSYLRWGLWVMILGFALQAIGLGLSGILLWK